MKAPQHFAFIDALRGVAILSVIAFHTQQAVTDLAWPAKSVAANGKFGVQLFFILSAVTLLNSWHARSDGAANFYIRRLFRIAPLFWFGIALYLVVIGSGPSFFAPNGLSWWHYGLTALFIHGIHPETFTSVVPGGWSIAAEMTFYLFFPLLAAAITNLRAAIVALVLTILFEGAFHFVGHPIARAAFSQQPEYLLDMFLYFSILNQVSVFSVGFVVFFGLSHLRLSKRWSIIGIGMAATLIVIQSLYNLPGPHHIEFALSFGLLAFFCGKSGVAFGSLLRLIGKYSFSGYILHYAVLRLVAQLGIDIASPLWRSLVMYALTVALTFALSAITYRLIERVGIRLAERLIAARSVRLAPG